MMLDDKRVAIIGGGKMGEALLAGWLDSDSRVASPDGNVAFVVVEPNEVRRDHFKKTYGVGAVASVADIETGLDYEAFDLVVLAVKPQMLGEVLDQLASEIDEGADMPLFVSIAAGKTTACIEAAFAPREAHVVRVMPNTPLMVGQGASVIAAGAHATPQEANLVEALFSALGFARQVDEADIDAVCALSGGGPAYVAAMVEALRDAAVEDGLEPHLAEQLVVHTIAGTCTLMQRTGQTPEETRIAVCSPGGTTLAALAAMEEGGFTPSLQAGIHAAVRRAKELATCS